ncbi:hypothetical protein ABZ626_03520 [Streptomyces longispororuber]|uniref:hypothetical protein n=1 Tax=Streptomyces longispororuber TaxID=68230 RepID=UPI003400F6D4
MTISPQKQWLVVCHEPNPATVEIVAVEPAPEDDTALTQRSAELKKSGHFGYLIEAPDEDTASDEAGHLWAQSLLASPQRLAAADAYIANPHSK